MWLPQSLHMMGALSDRFAGVRRVTAHVNCWLVLAFTQINDMPEQTIRRPLRVADLDDHLRADPMYPRQHQR